jgi:hypothetical protein
MSRASGGKADAKSFGLEEIYIPKPQYVPQYGEIMMAS